VTFPTLKPLYPVTIDVKVLLVATSNRYPVAPATADQFAVKLVWIKEVAAEAVGAVGEETIVNDAELVAVPPAVVTETVPVVPDPTVTVSTVPVFETMAETAVPPIVTEAPVRFVPLITRLPPAHTLLEPRLDMVGRTAATMLT